MNTSEPASAASGEVGAIHTETATVEEGDTVSALVPGMPPVASTPYLVTLAELACYRMVQQSLAPGQITVGSRLLIDHSGPSKVGATLLVAARIRERNKNRFQFDVRIQDGNRTVATVEHERSAIPLEKMMSTLNGL